MLNLTDQQRAILDLLREGKDDHDIAGELGISPATVRKHMQNAKERNDNVTRVRLAVLAEREER